jgi:hypothetical protein
MESIAIIFSFLNYGTKICFISQLHKCRKKLVVNFPRVLIKNCLCGRLVANAVNQFDEVWMGKFCEKCGRKGFCGDLQWWYAYEYTSLEEAYSIRLTKLISDVLHAMKTQE